MVVAGIDDQWSADLMDLVKFAIIIIISLFTILLKIVVIK
jgi:hypothetical protein